MLWAFKSSIDTEIWAIFGSSFGYFSNNWPNVFPPIFWSPCSLTLSLFQAEIIQNIFSPSLPPRQSKLVRLPLPSFSGLRVKLRDHTNIALPQTLEKPENTKGGSITLPLTSCLTSLESAV
jgi:hypothetical protein